MTYSVQTYESPMGPLYLVAHNGKLNALLMEAMWHQSKGDFPDYREEDSPILKEASLQLDEYFAGKRRSFELALDMQGTEFQRRAWRALQDIPFGETISYKQQAAAIASPKAVRAIGRANGSNRLCIVLPCHRVIASNGNLSGYAGGIEAKTFLLSLEAATVAGGGLPC